MTIKCDICHEKIETLYLEKINGTYLRKDKKMKTVCNRCQKKFKETVQAQIK